MTINATLNPVVEAIHKHGFNLIRLEKLESAITAEFVTAIGAETAPNWSTYSTWRTAWVDTLTARGVSNTVLSKRWSRLMKDCGVTIPKSDTKAAQEKDKARVEEKAKIDAMDDSALEKRAKALKELGEAKTAKKYERELEKREESRKPENVAKATIADFIKALKALDPAKVNLGILQKAYDSVVVNHEE